MKDGKTKKNRSTIDMQGEELTEYINISVEFKFRLKVATPRNEEYRT